MFERKLKVILVQVGSPKGLKVSDVREYLKEFLSDRRVIDLNPIFWKIILYLFILPFRPKKSLEKYKRIISNGTFPLITYTEKFSKKLDSILRRRHDCTNVSVSHAFLLSSPRIDQVFSESQLQSDDEVLFIPMFPQFSESTTMSALDGLKMAMTKSSIFPNVQTLNSFHRSRAFIESSAKQIKNYLELFKREGKNPDVLLLSFHGIQKRRVIMKSDPYYLHAIETFLLLRKKLMDCGCPPIAISFQSRFGSEEWLTPYTEDVVLELIKENKKSIAIYSPSFVADCLETIDELGFELDHFAKEHGGKIHFIPSLNDDDEWVELFSDLVISKLKMNQSGDTNLYCTLEKSDYVEYEKIKEKELKMVSPPLNTESKKSLKIVFFTIFLDLLGFSIILPLFPSIAKYYLEYDSSNAFLNFIFTMIGKIETVSGGINSVSNIVLFGGILGAVYSILQFVAAPMWGALSDRIGRRPVLLISLIGMAFSYIVWFFSGSFTLLLISRVIDGIMGGNISTATAVVSDVTDLKNRAKGMAIIGVAFALGFIVGPSLGGIFSTINLVDYYPSLRTYGINPFSACALVAFILTVANIISVYFNFKETLRPELQSIKRSGNVFQILKPLPYRRVNLINISNLIFTTAFSGMEFTLTFLAFERLNFGPIDNAFMFVFIGFIIAFVQGGVVRRVAHVVGELKMAIMGLIAVIPGLLIITYAFQAKYLYLGLFFLGVGSSMVIPCLTSLLTFYSPVEDQGRSVGMFRSMGALARAVGPISASIIYFRYGSASPYLIAALLITIPIAILIYLSREQIT